MPKDRRKHNKDYYNIAGTTPGATSDDAREAWAQERAALRRGEEHKLPGPMEPAAPRTEGGPRREKGDSALDRLPRPVGAAGVPRSQKPTDG